MSPNISETTLCFCTSFCKPIVCHRKNKHIPGTWSLGIPNLLSPVSDHHLQNGLAPIFGREPNKLLTEICIQEVHHTGPWCSRPLRKAWLSQLWDKAIGYPWISIRDISPSFDQFGWLNTLVGGFNFSEKYESHLGLLFPIYGKTKFMFQTTNQHKILLAEAPWLVNLHLDAGRSWNSSRLQQCFRWTFPVGQQAPGTSRSCLATCHPQDFLKSRVKYHHMHT